MMMGYLYQGKVKRAYYCKQPHPQNPDAMIDMLVVEVKWLGDIHEVGIPNGQFAPDNLALQFMAYCNVRPSTLDEVEGSMVPMIDHPEAGVTIMDAVFDKGAKQLQDVSWMPEQ